MLGKLIKYDLKSMNRFLILIHAFLIIVSVFARFFLSGHLFNGEVDISQEPYFLSFILLIIVYILLIAGVYFSTYLVIIVRFYKNLFSDQGYLTHTLPVTKGQHLLSKSIAGCIWGFLDMLLLVLSAYIVFVTPFVRDFFISNQDEIRFALGFTGKYANVSWGTVIVILLFFSLLSVISNLIMYYASIAIGQLVPGHKILGALAAYFVLTTALSILTFVAMAIIGLSSDLLNPDSFNQLDYMKNSLIFSGVFSAITSIILYIATYWIMRKRINLE